MKTLGSLSLERENNRILALLPIFLPLPFGFLLWLPPFGFGGISLVGLFNNA